MRSAVDNVGRRLPHGWGDLFRQLAIIMCGNFAYEVARGVADGERAVAMAHGEAIINLEAQTGTLFEPHLQALFLPAQGIIDFANQIYLNSQFVVVVAFFFWLYIWRNDAYYFVRNMFMVAMSFALIGYTLYPTAPPRMFPEHNFVDTINDFSNVNHDSAVAKLLINPYAAVPSLHCAFAAMIGGTGFVVCRSRWAKAFWLSWPILVIWVVMVTGNHYWIDAALGVMVAAASALVASQLLARAGPESWTFRNQPRTVEA